MLKNRGCNSPKCVNCYVKFNQLLLVCAAGLSTPLHPMVPSDDHTTCILCRSPPKGATLPCSGQVRLGSQITPSLSNWWLPVWSGGSVARLGPARRGVGWDSGAVIFCGDASPWRRDADSRTPASSCYSVTPVPRSKRRQRR